MDFENKKAFHEPQKWCQYIINVGYMIVGLIVLAHTIWYFAARSILSHPPDIYLRYYIILPGIGLFALVGLSDILVRTSRTSIFTKEWLSLTLFIVITLYLCLSHEIARVLLAAFMLSIFGSTIFSNIKLCRIMFMETIIALLLISGIIYLVGQLDGAVVMQVFVAGFMCTCAYLLSGVMVQYGRYNLSALIKYDAEQQYMREQIKRDTFTELYNRKTFDEYLSQWFPECQRSKEALHMAMIDIDDFKVINDQHGHAMGDRVLQYFSHCLKKIQTSKCLAFRMGGDEFSILMKDCSSKEACHICEALLTQLHEFPKRSIDEKTITLSCGIVSMEDVYKDTKSFTKAADEALYIAKNDGKNQVFVSS